MTHQLQVTVRRMTLSQIARAIRDLERRGWECIAPVRKISNSKKIFRYDERCKRFIDFEKVESYDGYFVKMRKVREEREK